jgi:hypothetical protein
MSSIDLIMEAVRADIPPNIAQDIGDEIWEAKHQFDMQLLEFLAGYPDVQTMIDRYREEPGIYGSVLAQALADAAADQDAAVTEAAGEVLALVDPLDNATDSEDVRNVPGTYGAGDAGAGHV